VSAKPDNGTDGHTKTYSDTAKLVRALRGLYRERCRLRKEAVGLKAQYDEVMKRYHAGRLDGGRAATLAYAILDRLELVSRELLPLVEGRAKDLLQAYTANGGGILAATQVPGSADRPRAEG